MADRHVHRHGGKARSNANPYGAPSDASKRVAERAGAAAPPTQQLQRQQNSSSGGGNDGQPSQTSFNSHTQPKKNTTNNKRSAAESDEPDDSYDARLHTFELERDPHRLAQREKQIQMGKVTPEYAAYIQQVPINQREYARRYDDHPLTPNKNHQCSKRSWDGQVRKWRRLLHKYDAPTVATAAGAAVAMGKEDQEMKDSSAQPSAPMQPPPAQFANTNSVSSFSTNFAAAPPAFSNPASSGSSSTFSSSTFNANFNPTAFSSAASQTFSATPASIPPARKPVIRVSQIGRIGVTQSQPAAAIPTPITINSQPNPAAPVPSASPNVLFTSSVSASPTYNDRLSSFDEDDLDLLPPPNSMAATTGATSHADEDLLDYDPEEEMQNEALAAARALQ